MREERTDRKSISAAKPKPEQGRGLPAQRSEGRNAHTERKQCS